MECIYAVRGTGPWGDYGRILAHGMTSHLGRTADGRARLERTGPFIPEVTQPGLELLVTRRMRERLEAENLVGASFVEVEKARIVRLSWELWDRAAPRPESLPQEGEPENYILGRKHDSRVAEVLGPIFELIPSGKARVRVVKINHAPPPDAPLVRNPFTGELRRRGGRTEYRKYLEDTDGADFLQSENTRTIYVSDRARALIDSEWLEFEKVTQE